MITINVLQQGTEVLVTVTIRVDGEDQVFTSLMWMAVALLSQHTSTVRWALRKTEIIMGNQW